MWPAEFPHHGAHLANDAQMAEITISLISVLVILLSFVTFAVVLTHY